MIILLLHAGLLRRHAVLNATTLAVYLGNAALLLASAYLFYLGFEKHTSHVRDFLYRRLLPGSHPP